MPMKKLLFVDDELRVLQGLQRQLYAMRREWDMHFVESAPKALEYMATEPVEVIVSDMMMPGMDGAQLLTEVTRLYPHTVRLVLSGQADREAVLRLVGPAHQYLSKPCNADELHSAIARALALRDLLSNNQLKDLASRLRSLPTLPAMHQQLTAELSQEQPSMERVAEIISQDVGMTTKVLQLVNSAFFGLPEPAATPLEAAFFLGLSTIRALVLSLHVFSQFDGSRIKGFSADELARHGQETARIAKRIATMQHCENKMDEQCFLAGLLHDVGQLILASEMPERYGGVLRAAQESCRPIWEAERAEFGATHAEVGAYLLGLWGLPNPVVEAVALHHRPADCAGRGFSPAIAVHVADVLAHENQDTAGAMASCEIDLAVLAGLGLEERLDAWRGCCAEKV
jgi:HD-like signal output (HDOD) protein/CheY-like chemotaxis protein